MSFVEVDGNKIWFEKYGSGPEVVLLLPGPIGTATTDFPELLDSEDELDFDKFTAIAVEPLGTGRSRPPHRSYNNKVYQNECVTYYKFMQNLGYDHFSLIGWSEGAKVALLMAIKYQETIDALILVSLSKFWSNRSLNAVFSNKSIEKWPKDKINTYLKCYDSKDEVQKLWTRYIKFIEFYNQYFPNDIFEDKYHHVKCPVLLVHGDKDQTIEVDQPTKICKRLHSGRLHRYPNGDHDCHQKYASNFKMMVEDHILNRENYTTKDDKSVEEKAKCLEEILYQSFK